MKAYLHQSEREDVDSALYIEHRNGELSLIRDMNTGHWPVFQLPAGAVELDDSAGIRSRVLDEVRDAVLAGVPMSKGALDTFLALIGSMRGEDES